METVYQNGKEIRKMNDKTEEVLHAMGENSKRDRTLVRWLICLVALACALAVFFGGWLIVEVQNDTRMVHKDLTAIQANTKTIAGITENKGEMLERVERAQKDKAQANMIASNIQMKAYRLALFANHLAVLELGKDEKEMESLAGRPKKTAEAWLLLLSESREILDETQPQIIKGISPDQLSKLD